MCFCHVLQALVERIMPQSCAYIDLAVLILNFRLNTPLSGKNDISIFRRPDSFALISFTSDSLYTRNLWLQKKHVPPNFLSSSMNSLNLGKLTVMRHTVSSVGSWMNPSSTGGHSSAFCKNSSISDFHWPRTAAEDILLCTFWNQKKIKMASCLHAMFSFLFKSHESFFPLMSCHKCLTKCSPTGIIYSVKLMDLKKKKRFLTLFISWHIFFRSKLSQ